MIEDQAVGAPQDIQEEPKKKVTIVNFVRKRAQAPAPPQEKPNENSSTRKETRKSSVKMRRDNTTELMKRPPRKIHERNEMTSKSAEHSYKSRSDRTVQKSVHSTAFKSVAAGSFTLDASVPEDFLAPLPPPVLKKKPRREKSIFEDQESYEESMKGVMIDETRPIQAIVEEPKEVDQANNTKDKRTPRVKPQEKAGGERKKLTDIEEVYLDNTGKQQRVHEL